MLLDTLEVTEELVNGGFKRQQAEAQARTFLKMFARILDDRVATKGDLKEVRLSFKQDFNGLKQELNEVKQDLEIFKRVNAQDMAILKQNMEAVHQQMGLMKQKMDMMKLELTHDLTRKIGKIMVGGVTFISGFMAILMTIFHYL